MPVEIGVCAYLYMSGYFTFKVAAVFYGKGISDVFMHWVGDRSIEVYIVLFTRPFL